MPWLKPVTYKVVPPRDISKCEGKERQYWSVLKQLNDPGAQSSVDVNVRMVLRQAKMC